MIIISGVVVAGIIIAAVLLFAGWSVNDFLDGFQDADDFLPF